ncbi:dihydrolipoamide acetyltransferase family protein [Culturomica massiliensis]|uniref:dihydrolipoamide acetyltransferase family protein n=1 Tax=Culturomica massiliensis TaxID=1841857 RepID=UPI0008398F87|nr:dihydrolipoamide acetyltransferase family protein [Culturomica massiliensis]
MSIFEIKMPKLGESITEGTITSWSAKVGDTIKEDDILLEVNTAKVSAEIPSPVSGKIVQIFFQTGDVVPIGKVIATVDTDGNGTDNTTEAAPPEKTETSVPEPTATTTAAPASIPVTAQAAKSETERWYSPIVLQIAQEAKISNEELAHIKGTGYQGRLSKKDINEYIGQKKKSISATTPVAGTKAEVPISSPAATPSQHSSTPDNAENEIRPMDYVRRLIADHMVMSKNVSPHVTSVIEVDVTKLVQWRNKNKDAFFRREGVKLTFMPVIAEASAKALAEYPLVNSSVDGYNIILKKHIHIGFAVSLPDGNLIVPVVHDADHSNLNGLAVAMDTLALKARDNKLLPEDIAGGTFTITNFGTFKSLFGTPIINQPQVAILGVGYIEKKPAVIETPEGDAIAIRHKMYLSLSYDHRVIDGALGGQFLRRVGDILENWQS